MQADNPRHLTIIGAGLAGALLATLLARRGWQVDVHEKRSDPRERDLERGRSINLALAERGRHALRQADADDAVMAQAVMMRGRMVHFADGRTDLQRYGRDDSEVIWSVHRGELNQVLLDIAERAGAKVHFHQRLDRVDFDRRIAFFGDERDGSQRQVPFQTLVGADGAGSVLRGAMAAETGTDGRTDFLDHSYKELEIPPGADGSFRMEANALHIWPRGRYMCIALPNDESTFTVTLFLPNQADPDAGVPGFDTVRTGAEARALFDREFPDASHLIPDLERDFDHNPTGILGTLYLDRWHLDERAVLVGDAAHAMVPFHGQGMNCAFEDCVALAEHLDRTADRAAALAAFQAERLPNARAIQHMALENYLEMRDRVDDDDYLLQRELERRLADRHPDRFVPRYAMVTFRHLPYAIALQRGNLQRELLVELTRGHDSLDSLDWAIVDAAITARLPPLLQEHVENRAMPASFLFYDLETFGADPRSSRIAQFAAIRTDADLNPIDDPISLFVQPADDLLPSPVATLITGITPQHAQREGMTEADAFALIFEEMSRPETCSLGYNSLRFDDEFVRYGFFRNFFDAYEREWRGGNSRWDLLDVFRFAHALRPEGLVWPKREDGTPSFKLEHLAEANDVREGDAHEALSDVRALIGLARKLKSAQPKLWDHALRLRDKRHAASLLDTVAMTPVLNVSQRFPASRMCAAPVIPLARHPHIDNRVIVFDLTQDPQALLDLDAEAIAARLYVRAADLAEGEERVALKEIHLNRSPALSAWEHLRVEDFERLGIDPVQAEANAARLRAAGPALVEKVRQVFAREREHRPVDVDASLYDSFIGDGDKRLFPGVRSTPPEALGAATFAFRDARLPELLFRYRARNWPGTLSAEERARWDDYRRQRLLGDPQAVEYGFERFDAELAELRTAHANDASRLVLLEQLETWRNDIDRSLA